ncbi:hypothetical protein PTH_1773 [Pelotomaculum thermopropionicum SI]|uniref:Uncharacterized protein n=1 Tax=Pelotomaculum thermopropionicum (strain DSM 13744 / JCM 10971 / SI) TaxID=370438 RepID=A5D1E2_PELTS|nr:hypothetical protein PTH_1773 [Pelotomaculum thermopropionicum SI]
MHWKNAAKKIAIITAVILLSATGAATAGMPSNHDDGCCSQNWQNTGGLGPCEIVILYGGETGFELPFFYYLKELAVFFTRANVDYYYYIHDGFDWKNCVPAIPCLSPM